MSRTEQRVVLLLTAAVIAGLLASVYPPPPLPLMTGPYKDKELKAWDGKAQFSTTRAWMYAETLATRFPGRWSGSADRAEAADWIKSTLTGLGLEVKCDVFCAKLGRTDKRDTFCAKLGQSDSVRLENVWGTIRGAELPDEIIVAVGNYDMAPTSFQAASDTAGHVGTLLELARVLHESRPRRTVIFFFPDGEEWGMLGARHFAKTFPERQRIVAVLSIEDLDVGRFQALGINGIGQFRGFAPMWLRSLAAHAASLEKCGEKKCGKKEVTPLQEWLQRSVLVSATDQGPFLGEGIPAVQLGGRGDAQELQREVYHRPDDTIEKMRPASVGTYGRIQERILRAIDAMDRVPKESDFYLRIAAHRIVPRERLLAVQVAVFLPLLVTVVLRWRRYRLPGATAACEACETGLLLFVLLTGMLTVKILPRVGVMPQYELYPATARHPLLTDVYWSAMLIAAGVVVGAAGLAGRLDRSASPTDDVNLQGNRVTAVLLWLLLVAGVAMVDNPFGAVTFLVLPSLLWIWIEPAHSRRRRLTNVVLVVVGFLPILGLMVQYAQELELGLYIVWYLFMSVAYGQFSTLRITLALATVAIGLRLVSVASLPLGSGGRVGDAGTILERTRG